MSADARNVERIVDLRRVMGAVGSRAEQRRLTAVIREMRSDLDVGLPKRRAAALLGISPQALDRWIGEGLVPTLRKPGSSRELVERDALIRLLGEVRGLREAGEKRPVAKALRDLQARGEITRSLSPNQSAQELRYEYLHTTPAQRLRAASVLSRTAHQMAAKAQTRREAR
jgi:hypothetical protein